MFYVLQIRPIVNIHDAIEVDFNTIKKENTLIMADHALGNGVIDNIYDVVYVKPDSFDPSKTKEIAELIGSLNNNFLKEDKNYILIGPGRWGSSDPWLGIPVKWPQISAARVIIESGLDNYRIDPSQGTHFFQNLTSFGVGYFTLNPFIHDGYYDVGYLKDKQVIYEDSFIRHIRFEGPLQIIIDGRKNKAVIFKEGKAEIVIKK